MTLVLIKGKRMEDTMPEGWKEVPDERAIIAGLRLRDGAENWLRRYAATLGLQLGSILIHENSVKGLLSIDMTARTSGLRSNKVFLDHTGKKRNTARGYACSIQRAMETIADAAGFYRERYGLTLEQARKEAHDNYRNY